MSLRANQFYIFSRMTLLAGLFLLFACSQQTSDASSQGSTIDVEQRLKELGVELREPAPPTANYVRAVRTGNLVFLAGHGPSKPEGGAVTGKVGQDLDLEQAQAAARLTGISLLSSLKAEIGDLNKVKRVIKVHGMINAVPNFTQHSQVMNGFSDFIVSVFGDKGRHARAAVGMGSLPRNIAVEIEMIVEVE
ncbi:MAG: RidA family protein [bacterium]